MHFAADPDVRGRTYQFVGPAFYAVGVKHPKRYVQPRTKWPLPSAAAPPLGVAERNRHREGGIGRNAADEGETENAHPSSPDSDDPDAAHRRRGGSPCKDQDVVRGPVPPKRQEPFKASQNARGTKGGRRAGCWA